MVERKIQQRRKKADGAPGTDSDGSAEGSSLREQSSRWHRQAREAHDNGERGESARMMLRQRRNRSGQ